MDHLTRLVPCVSAGQWRAASTFWKKIHSCWVQFCKAGDHISASARDVLTKGCCRQFWMNETNRMFFWQRGKETSPQPAMSLRAPKFFLNLFCQPCSLALWMNALLHLTKEHSESGIASADFPLKWEFWKKSLKFSLEKLEALYHNYCCASEINPANKPVLESKFTLIPPTTYIHMQP